MADNAPFSPWGPEAAGDRVWNLDQVAMGLRRAQTDQAAAHARYFGAEADAKALEVANMKRFQALMQTRALGQSADQQGDMEDKLWDLAGMAADSGMLTQAEKLSGAASLVSYRRQATATQAATENVRLLQGVRQQANILSETVGTAKDEDSWRIGNELYRSRMGEPSPYADMPYSPELVDQINKSAMTANQRATEAERALTRRATKDYRDRRLKQIDKQNDIRDKRLDIERNREDRLAKGGGGKSVVRPSDGEIKAAKTLITKEFPDIEGAQDAAYNIASEARALMRANPALDSSTAISQAYQAARANGDFTSVDGAFGTRFGRKTTYGSGKSSASPRSLPMAEGKIDAGKLKPKTWYMSPQGVPGMWTGRGFVLAGPSSSTGAPGEDGLDDDEEED